MLMKNVNHGLCSSPINILLLNKPFKGKEGPAKTNFMPAKLLVVLVLVNFGFTGNQ